MSIWWHILHVRLKIVEIIYHTISSVLILNVRSRISCKELLVILSLEEVEAIVHCYTWDTSVHLARRLLFWVSRKTIRMLMMNSIWLLTLLLQWLWLWLKWLKIIVETFLWTLRMQRVQFLPKHIGLLKLDGRKSNANDTAVCRGSEVIKWRLKELALSNTIYIVINLLLLFCVVLTKLWLLHHLSSLRILKVPHLLLSENTVLLLEQRRLRSKLRR